MRQKNVKMRSDDNQSGKDPIFDLSIVFSLAGIITVASVIGMMALQNTSMRLDGSNVFTKQMSPSPSNEIARGDSDLHKKIARLEKQLSTINGKLTKVSMTQSTTSQKVAKIEDAFNIVTGSIPASAPMRQSSQSRLLDTGWNADDMVTRKRKKDSISTTKSRAPKMDKMSGAESDSGLTFTQFAVELSAYKNIITARMAWDKLSENHKNLLGHLKPRLVPIKNSDDVNKSVRLVVGPIKNAINAAQICATLRTAGSHCQERVFAPSLAVVSAF